MSILLETERLLLRPPRAADISHFIPLLTDFDVAKNLSRVPHPYTEDHACAFIVAANHARRNKMEFTFSILRKEPSAYVGICGIHPLRNWEFGYWLGKPFWGLGYATEAAHRLVTYAFEALALESVHAGWFYDNPASGHVLAKLGARHNGSAMRECRARGMQILCHDMLLTRADFLRKQAA